MPVHSVLTLSPERTLVEKLAMLHNSACQALEGNERRLENAGRHYYDIARLLEAPEVRANLTPEQVAQIAADSDEWSARGGFPFTPRPQGGFAASPAFADGRIRDVVAASYRQAMTWVWGGKPTLDECVAIVAAHADLL